MMRPMTNQQLKAHCEDVIANPQDHLDWVVDMARVALASLEAEPVAYVHPAYLQVGALGFDASIGRLAPAQVELYTAPPVAVMHPDELRMDWLCAHSVEVRKPLMYGSHAMFHAQQDSEEWDLPHHTTLREQIDEAIRAAGGSVKE